MKRALLYILIFNFQLGFSQVGIGTDSPAPGYNLDVAGSLLIQENLKINPFSDDIVIYDDYKFLTRLLNSEPVGEIAKLDLAQLNVAPITVFDYVFTNIRLDNVNAVDLQFDARNYIVGVANFRYEGQNIRKGKVDDDFMLIGNFVSRVYVRNNKWYIEIRNRGRNSSSNNAINYYVTLIVYDKKYFEELAPIEVNFQGQTTGQSASPF